MTWVDADDYLVECPLGVRMRAARDCQAAFYRWQNLGASHEGSLAAASAQMILSAIAAGAGRPPPRRVEIA